MKTLFVVVGPTGIGKTAVSIKIAKALNTEIVSSDSRQIYRGIPIGTACPSAQELSEVKHHFIETIELDDYFSCGRFEIEALKCLEGIFAKNDYAVMCGGSMLYVDALCKGIDDLPDVDKDLRDSLWKRFEEEGIDNIYGELKILDPEYAKVVDIKNHKRVIHALELCIESGKPYSELRTQTQKTRDFRIVKIGLTLPREEVYDRINRRVDAMVANGLEDEARSVYHLRHLNSLNTVGFKEMFAYISGECSKESAIESIKTNTRRYAKKQLTWWQRDTEIKWVSPYDWEAIQFIIHNS
ncbi:MAG: tRNA (adenosine(37)-N6)-dimethylallyltransferase MiaA [Paludibacteraceae bacterium]|nr:tRNA (adenosine(37)-N6)-dimethylallyltransferase MiaA [Paludibacteraceae bacterium]